MATLNVFSDHDTSREIDSMEDLIAAIPADPHIPSIHALDTDGLSVQIFFGDPDQRHHTVKLYSALGVEKATYDSIEQASAAFFELAQLAF